MLNAAIKKTSQFRKLLTLSATGFKSLIAAKCLTRLFKYEMNGDFLHIWAIGLKSDVTGHI